MNSAIQKLNGVICEEYVIEITCDQSHIIDRYEVGEGEESSFFENFYSSKRESTVDSIGINLKEAVDYVLNSYTQFNNFEEYFADDLNYSDDYFIVRRQVNKEYSEPTKEEVERWKNGEEDLYAQYTHIKIKVNTALIDVAMISELIEREQ